MDIGIGRWTPCRSNVTFLDVFASEKVNLTVGVVGMFYACFFEYRTDSDESSQKSAWIETEKRFDERICITIGGGLKYFLEFSPRKLGKMNPSWLAHIFLNGLFETTN